MKIYCSRRNKEDLDYYVGKNIWIKVCTSNYLGDEYWWIKVTNMDENTYSCDVIDDSALKTANYISKYAVNSYVISKDDIFFNLVKPIEILTEDEIFKHRLRKDYQNELDRFIGKDVWVLCNFQRKDGDWSHQKAWIRIVGEDDDKYLINLALAGYGEYDSRSILEKDMYLNRVRPKLKSELKLVKPIQALTTDEFFSEEEEDIGDLIE